MSTDASFEDAINVLLATSQMEFPVIDYAGKVMGLLRSDTLIAALSQNSRFEGIIIADRRLATPFGGNIARRLEELNLLGASAMTAISRDCKVSGMLTRQNII